MDAEQNFRYPYTLNVKPPRGTKTSGTEGVDLYEMIMNPLEDLRIYVPNFKIGKKTLKDTYDWIDKSPLLKAFIRRKSGKPQLSTVGWQFDNMSNVEIWSMKGDIEAHNVTIMRIEEFDLWQWEWFQDDVMRRGAAKNANGMPTRIRITGTIMGQENIYKILTNDNYKKMFRNLMHTHKGNLLGIEEGTPFDVYTLLAMDILDEKFVKEAADTLMSPDEWARSMLLQFTESRNFIWSSYLFASQKKALEWELEPVPFKKGERYKTNGIVTFGFDCAHAGQKKDASKYSLQIYEQNGRYKRWLNGFEWTPDYDTSLLEKELIEIFAFYRPAGGNGDALQYQLIANLNDKAYKEGITNICRSDFPENTPGNWDKWWFSPLRNDAKNKFLYYEALKYGIHKGRTFYPFVDIKDTRREARMLRKLIKSILNIREEETKGSYPSYRQNDSKIEDDSADAAAMAEYWLDVHIAKPINFDLIKTTGKFTETSRLSTSILRDIQIDKRGYNYY